MSYRPIVAFLTDFGTDSFYVGAMKAALLAANPNVTMMDVTHGVRGFDVAQASFVLARVLPLLPPRTVIVAVVDPGVGGPRRNLIFDVGQRTVVAPDNGLISDVACDLPPDRCIAICDDRVAAVRFHPAYGATFLGRDVFAPVAAALCGGANPQGFGDPVRDFQLLDLGHAEVRPGVVMGRCRYVDGFGNLLTNITTAMLHRAFPGVPLSGICGTAQGRVRMEGIHRCFVEGRQNEPMLLINSWGLVEVAINQGSAADHFGGGVGIGLVLAVDG